MNFISSYLSKYIIYIYDSKLNETIIKVIIIHNVLKKLNAKNLNIIKTNKKISIFNELMFV